jgi:hypothetical protein
MVVINLYSTQNPSIVAATRRYHHIGIPATERREGDVCMVWSSYHIGPRTSRRRKRESFPRAGCVRFDEREQETEPGQTGLR